MKSAAGKHRAIFYLAGVALVLCCAVPPAPAFAAAGDTAFLAAREAFRKGEPVRAPAALPGHPLQVWAEYWQLRQRLEDDDASGIAAFLTANEGSYLAEKLRGDWLRYLGEHADWVGFQREFALLVQPDAELNCYAAQAAGTPQNVRPLWLSGQDLPAACDTAVDQLVAAGGLTVEDVWQRMRRVLKAGKLGAGKTAALYLPADQGFDGSRLEAVAADPLRYFRHLPQDFAATRGGREMALFALQTLARSDTQEAASRLSGIEAKLTSAERTYVWGELARIAAWRHQPEALAWYDKIAGAPLDDEQLAWHVRAALRAQEWAQVQRAIAAMPTELAQRPEWIYWQGRALAALGRAEDARAQFAQIAGQPDFYGNLADEELGRTIGLPPQAAAPAPGEMAAARANPGLQRALNLFRLDMRVEGVREWNWSLRGMDDRALLAAADLARRNEVWDRAISTADRTLTQHDYSLRYIAPFRAWVEPAVQELALDTGWVYGLMRQESRFVTTANSSAGAKGLMQIMPATARWVAKRIRLADFHPRQVAEIDTNVRLGTNYLKLVLGSFDQHPVLASAAYNAGPSRARRWLGEQALEGAIYAETIPFPETRDYVKKVMSNAVYYNLLFDSAPQSLKNRLGVVNARGDSGTAAEMVP